MLDPFTVRTAERFAGKDAEPDFNLIQPTGGGGREMKMHLGMGRQPLVVLLVNTVMVEDDVNLLILGKSSQHVSHECQQLQATLLLGGLRVNSSSCPCQGRKLSLSTCFGPTLILSFGPTTLRF